MRLSLMLTAAAMAASGCAAAATTTLGGDAAFAAATPGDASKGAQNDPRPFNERANAMQDVDAALLSAQASGRRVLLVLGGDWCHDSRGLAAKFEEPALAALIAERYELVFVDVGRRDRNLDVAERFGVEELRGTPTVLIISPDGALLNADSVHDWSNAAARTSEETYAYFLQQADQ